jgi:23S rRNA (guanosine2251-2'-O)-methyltransferase
VSELVYGQHAVTALLRSNPGQVARLLVLAGRHDGRMQKLLQQARREGIAITELARAELDRRCNGNHQGVIAELSGAADEAAGPSWREEDLPALVEASPEPLLLVLDGVTDPHNLGACLRSADAAGVTAVIAPRDKAAGLTPVVRKVACGAAESVPFIQVTNLARTLQQLQAQGVWVVGTAGEAGQSLFEQSLTGPLALVMGAEGSGMRRLTKEHCDFLVNLPMAGSVSSLNVSVATGICLFEAVRQRRGRARAGTAAATK